MKSLCTFVISYRAHYTVNVHRLTLIVISHFNTCQNIAEQSLLALAVVNPRTWIPGAGFCVKLDLATMTRCACDTQAAQVC